MTRTYLWVAVVSLSVLVILLAEGRLTWSPIVAAGAAVLFLALAAASFVRELSRRRR